MPSLRQRLLIIIIVIFLLLTYWYRQQYQTTLDSSHPQTAEIDYYFENFSSTGFDKQGNIHFQLKGESLTHHQADDLITIIEPRATVFSVNTAPPWHIQSKQATTYEDSLQDIRFTGMAHMSRATSGKHQAVSLKAENIRLKPQTEQLFAKQDVVLITNGATITGQTLNGDLQQQTFVMQQVQAIYQNAD